MKQGHPLRITALLALAHCASVSSAEDVYKCVKNGKTSYRANPSANDGQCQQTVIRDDGPSPEELARLLEQKKLRQEEDRKANEAALKEREVRAKELEAAAAAQRARATEEELRSLKQTPPPVIIYPPYYPYWRGLPIPMTPPLGNPVQPHHPSYEVPGGPSPIIQQLKSAPPNGEVQPHQ